MDLLAGWATHDDDASGLAHQVAEADTGASGAPPYRSLCGAISAVEGWTRAEPEAERCQECQTRAAGTPD